MATERTPGTLPELMKQLAALQSQVERVKEKEKADVIERMREAIAVYGITASDLFPKRGYVARKVANAVKVKRPYVKKRARRSFTDAERKEMVDKHVKMVAAGLSFRAACNKLTTAESVMRRWYEREGVPITTKKAA